MFVNACISAAPARVCHAFDVRGCSVAGATPDATIWVINEKGVEKMVNIIVEERKA
jgi:hypothetical protein